MVYVRFVAIYNQLCEQLIIRLLGFNYWFRLISKIFIGNLITLVLPVLHINMIYKIKFVILLANIRLL
jgi:hypothetical protein